MLTYFHKYINARMITFEEFYKCLDSNLFNDLSSLESFANMQKDWVLSGKNRHVFLKAYNKC